MRFGLVLLSLGLLSGCAGNVADHIGPRSSIVTPQLMRYNFGLGETRCVADRLGSSLTPLQLRKLVRVAASVSQGYYDPSRLSVRDFVYVAGTMDDDEVKSALTVANAACGVSAAVPQQAARPAPRAEEPGKEARAPSWLNLGAATTGQAVAVDAATIERQGTTRQAWFRLTNPGESTSTGVLYHLGVDCPAKMIDPIAHKVVDANGAVSEEIEYPPAEDDRMAAESGTILEIVWLAMCT